MRPPRPEFYARKGDAASRWKKTASFVVELGPNFAPLRVYRLRAIDVYPVVRYYAEHELRRLFERCR